MPHACASSRVTDIVNAKFESSVTKDWLSSFSISPSTVRRIKMQLAQWLYRSTTTCTLQASVHTNNSVYWLVNSNQTDS
uniref:Uncharacterized protein n=1 Tax=Arundo donax TaxID=35708 RepID=A0A0A9CRJ9_ARUDO